MTMTAFALALAMSGQAPVEPRVFEKVRSDGVTVVCVRHDRKPTIFTARVECKPAAQWRVPQPLGAQANSPAGTYTTDFAFTTPKATPRLVGK